MGTQKGRLAWIQALRGLAACMVLMVHSRGMLPGTTGKEVADHVFYPMAMGVDLFFLISGFLMVWTTRNFDGTRPYMWRFLVKRFSRIWPLLVVITPVALVAAHGPRGFLDRDLVLSYLEGLAFVPHDPAASGIYFQMAVGVAWTLCFEWYFYMVFAAAMLFGRWRYAAMAAWFALTLLVIPLCRGSYSLHVAAQPLVEWSRYANLAINPIVWDFVAGMAAGWLYGSRIRIGSPAMIYAVVSVLLVLLLMVWRQLGMVNFFGPQGWAAPLTILFVGIMLLAKIDAIRVPRWSVWMGGISYSLYLVHVSVFMVLQRIATAIPSEIVLLIRPVIALICAWALFRYVEAPFSTWARGRLLNLLRPADHLQGTRSEEKSGAGKEAEAIKPHLARRVAGEAGPGS